MATSRPPLIDAEDRQMLASYGVIAALVLVAILALALVLGLAVRVFLLASGLGGYG